MVPPPLDSLAPDASQVDAIMDAARMVTKSCLEIGRSENVLIVTDNATQLIGRALYLAVQEITPRVLFIMMPVAHRHGEEPPDPVADLMRRQDVIIAPTRQSLTHTKARLAATREGARIATMPGVTFEMFTQGGMTADFIAIRSSIQRAGAKIRKRSKAHVTSPAGTDVEFVIAKGKWSKEDTGVCNRPGMITNLPAGKIFAMPKEGTMNGTIVLDGSFESKIIEDEPVVLTVEDGLVTGIEGGVVADHMREMYTAVDDELPKSKQGQVWTMAEFGFGMNPNAQIIGNVLEDEKTLGTAYFSIGDNHALGGSVSVGIHVSAVLRNPTVKVGNLQILEDGELLIGG